MLFFYWIHVATAIIFVILLIFPFAARRLAQRQPQEIRNRLKAWNQIFLLANIGLIVAIVTGFLMKPDFASLWFWLVMADYLLLGALIGLAAKNLRLVQQGAERSENVSQPLLKLRRFGDLLALSILVMLILMSNRF